MFALPSNPVLMFCGVRPQVRRTPLVWAGVFSVLLHGSVLGWLPGLQHARNPAASPLSVLLPMPVVEQVAVSPAPTFEPVSAQRPKPSTVSPQKNDRPVPLPVVATSAPQLSAETPVVERVVEYQPKPKDPTAAPSPPFPEVMGPRYTAPDPAAVSAYGRHVAGAVALHQRYPRLAQLRQWQGTALLQLELAASGQLQSVRVLSSSGHDVLDQQAIAMVRAAAPLPPLPAALAGQTLTIDVPVVFRLAS
jgi:protein TonB